MQDVDQTGAAKLSRRRARLLSRIGRRYQTVEQTYNVGPLRLPFVRVADPDAVLDQIVEEEDRREAQTGRRREGTELHLPYWAELWDSSFGIGELLSVWGNFRLANRAATASDASSRKSVLDLGCGLGFTGMVAAAMGASVVFADLEPDALLFARLNSLRWAQRVRTRRLNWQKDRLEERFDLIIGADVLYDRTQWEFLERFFRAHLASEYSDDACVLLGEPGRQTGDDFPDWIRLRGWSITTVEQRVPSHPRAIRMFRLTPR